MAFIMVVDDDADVRDLIETTLRMDGHEVNCASGGSQALTAMREQQPDLLVTDQMMPGMTGLELVRAMREDHAIGDVPIILLTGTEKHRDLYVVDRWLEKPFSPARLRSHVQALLRRTGVEPSA
ncbi:response regulator transcription factor [Actinoplanes sp. NPDC051859]|uniref:response regulator transcription factor n=1 Tax=Actinoplanes sp. NPDC051859 TaxID=3363909 RepID=UPI0037ACA1AD